ncbi:MAG: ABC transporter ATP-binding protein [Rhizobiaceae bacterium]|nr:ABC transporter ATP-binding protein [Rhizobiaceae bacterium]
MALSLEKQSTSADARLELKALHKRLGGITIVDAVNLTISPGECVVLLGPSGCGKTTTLRMVAGFTEPDSGQIHLDGMIASGHGAFVPTERRQLGMVFQTYAIWPHKTVHDNVAFGLVCAGNDRATTRRKVETILEIVKLGGHGRRYPGDLSGGQQQRVALARAIVGEPSLLLLDEPLSNLDAGLREEMRFELKRLHRDRGMTMLYVTHDQEEALVLADRIAVMNGGRIEQCDAPDAIYRRPISRFVASFVGTNNIIEGRLVAKDGARLQVKTELGMPVWGTATDDFAAEAEIGSQVAIAVRPEDISLSTDKGHFSGHIIDASFLGNRYELLVDVAGRTLRVQTRRMPASSEDQINLSFDSEAARVVP